MHCTRVRAQPALHPVYRVTHEVHHGLGVSPYRPRLEIVTYHQLVIIDVLWERMISSEHDGWSRHIQLFGDTNSAVG